MSKAEELASRIHPQTDWYEFDHESWCQYAAAHLRALDASHQRLKEALEKARNGLSGGLWDYGPGQDEHTQCNALIEELDAALEQAKDLS